MRLEGETGGLSYQFKGRYRERAFGFVTQPLIHVTKLQLWGVMGDHALLHIAWFIPSQKPNLGYQGMRMTETAQYLFKFFMGAMS
jgi:hypothetical protein